MSDIDESEIPLFDPDAKVLSEVQEEFLKPHINWSPVQIKLENIVTTRTEHTCCWRTDDDDKIVLGGEGCLTVLRKNGVEKVYKLWNIDLRVVSGLAVTSEKQLICVEDLYSNAKEVHTVNIPHGLPDDTELNCVNTLDILFPVCLFVFDKLRYGVLCENSSIECYTLKNILLDREPTTSDVIKLGIDIAGTDTACATPDGNVVVTSTDNRSIHIYTANGDRLSTFSSSNTWTLDNDWHQIFWDGQKHRLFLQCFADGVIIVSDNKVICTLIEGNCAREEAGNVVKSMKMISHCVNSEGRIWFINGDTRNEVHIYTCNNNSVPHANTGRRKQCQPIAILEPSSGTCPYAVQYNKTIQTKKEHTFCWRSGSDGEIFLGGWDTITLLRDDETQTTYTLWDHNLGVKSAAAVTRTTHLICVTDKKGWTSAHVVNIATDIQDGTILCPFTELNVSNPIYIFPVNKICYGVLCKPCTIAVFTLGDILLERDLTVSHEITVGVGLSYHDTACGTPDENYCVTHWQRREITVYNSNGDRVYNYKHDLVGSGIKEWTRIFKDRKYHRLFVQCCDDGIVLVTDNGVVCKLKDERWEYVYLKFTDWTEHIGSIRHAVLSQERMFCVDGHSNVKVYNNYTSLSAMKNPEYLEPYIEQELTEPYIEQGPAKLVYDKAVTLTNKHVCCWRSNLDDGIFLGGNSTLTTLTDEDEGTREIVYTLWDKNLTIISGLAVSNVLHIICCRQNHSESHMFTVDISKHLSDTHLQPVKKFIFTSPIHVFFYNRLSYGTMCKPKKIKFFNLDNILFDTEYSGYLDLEDDVTDNDTACVTSSKLICVTSSKHSSVYLYSKQGEKVVCFIKIPAYLNNTGRALFVHCFKDNFVVVTDYGSICWKIQ